MRNTEGNILKDPKRATCYTQEKEITMKKFTIAIATAIATATAAAAATLVYTPGRARAKTIKVWNNIGKDIAADLHLTQMPTIAFDCHDSSAVMYVVGTEEYRRIDMFRKKIVGQQTDYVIHVNPVAIAAQLNGLHAAIMRDISEDFLITLFRHECRHLYQYQTGFGVGNIIEMFHIDDSIFSGHGASPAESDANIYAIDAAENKRQWLVAKLNKALQDEACKMSALADHSEAREYAAKLRKLPLFKR